VGESTSELPVLIALTRGMKGARWPLEEGAFLMGRGSDCDLTVADRQVSRHHARIECGREGYFLVDLGSKNGTHLNGERVEGRARLNDGDVIQIALALEVVFVGTEATLPLSLREGVGGAVGRLQMDVQAHRVWVGEREIDPPLSAQQYRLLELLHDSQGGVVTREQIIDHVWPGAAGEGVSEQAIDALVRRLRDRLAEVEVAHAYVVTVRGHGFRLDNPAAGGGT
jgi:hypothetical protein